MDERLKGLKKAMDNHTFQGIKFSDEHKKKITQQIEQQQEDVTENILSLLTQAKTGSELTQLLHLRGVKSIVNNEGCVYTILHTQELLGIIESYWVEGEKFYQLTNKGLKLVNKTERQKSGRLSKLFRGVRANEH